MSLPEVQSALPAGARGENAFTDLEIQRALAGLSLNKEPPGSGTQTLENYWRDEFNSFSVSKI